MSRQDILTLFNILIKFKAIKYLYSIHIQKFEDIQLKFQIHPTLNVHITADHKRDMATLTIIGVAEGGYIRQEGMKFGDFSAGLA